MQTADALPASADVPDGALRRVIATLPIPCWVYDLATRAFLEVNAAAERAYGYSRQEFLAMTLADIRRPAEAARLNEFLDARARGEEVRDPGHWVHRAKGGQEFAVSVQSTDVCWGARPARIVFVVDITAQRAASVETKLLYECLESADDVIVVTAADRDAAGDHPILYVNRAFEQRTGYARGEVLGRDARLLQGPATDRAAVAAIGRALQAWEPVKVELVNYTRAGEPYWVEMAITPVADDRGWYHYWFAVERDITERKRAEQGLAAANSELERRVAQRTRELQRMVHDLEGFNRMVSHDLQNPLNGVRGFAEMLQVKHGGALSADAGRMLGMIRRSADQMHHTIEELLSLSRIGNMQPRPVPADLAGLCTPMITSLRGKHPQREVQFQVQQSTPMHADLQLLRLAFLHLLDNAWKYTAKAAQATITVGARACAEGVVVTVQDNGVGFDAATAQGLFEPFKRLRGSSGFEGAGVGLAIVARAVDRLGGWVWAEGQVGQGARFHVFLPGNAHAEYDLPTLPGALGDG
jgi:PAS domain S-box-containing protein